MIRRVAELSIRRVKAAKRAESFKPLGPRFGIGLTMDHISMNALYALRSKYWNLTYPPHRSDRIRLLSKIPGVHRHRCEDVLRQLAPLHSNFELELKEPFRPQISKNGTFSVGYDVFSPTLEELHASLLRYFHDISDQMLSTHSLPYKINGVRSFAPKVNIAAHLTEGQAESIFAELKLNYPDGIGSITATGLNTRDFVAPGRTKQGPAPEYVEFPFSRD
ncbi:hypothetical protein L207DRAFT_519953 [Hyaloscypha variabilis F]|uniref:Uncharacterized protein n=1 Tax=Hyaloscypha variabilis (strain UAMH 11265 / GT02V1 / F) TaxID=1149755 RepID=A0A2J6QX84_HYAVF|nr:hypothetical protein L207DRAFT_519953 [Hyaloscypha variabilis F]